MNALREIDAIAECRLERPPADIARPLLQVAVHEVDFDVSCRAVDHPAEVLLGLIELVEELLGDFEQSAGEAFDAASNRNDLDAVAVDQIVLYQTRKGRRAADQPLSSRTGSRSSSTYIGRLL